MVNKFLPADASPTVSQQRNYSYESGYSDRGDDSLPKEVQDLAIRLQSVTNETTEDDENHSSGSSVLARSRGLGNNSTGMAVDNLLRELEKRKSELIKARGVIEKLMVEKITHDAEDLRQTLDYDGQRLGQWGPSRRWEDGQEVRELKKEKEALKRREQELRSMQTRPNMNFGRPTIDQIAAKEKNRNQLKKLERDKVELDEKETALEIEINAHRRELRRVDIEGSSKLKPKKKVSDILFLLVSTDQLSLLILYRSNSLCPAQRPVFTSETSG